MERIELDGMIDQNHTLSVVLPAHVKAGKVKVILEQAEVADEANWSQWIAHIWSRDWNDPREDIYSLEDGEPIDGEVETRLRTLWNL